MFVSRKCKWLIVLAVLITLVAAPLCLASGHGKQHPKKTGILLVAFGSSVKSAQVSFQNIDRQVKKAFPNIPVRWAYTSRIIRKKLAQQGKHLDSVAVALAKMMDEGFTHVAIQSLHTIRGEEYDDMVQTARAFTTMAEGFTRIFIGEPLLSREKDLQAAAAAVLENIPEDRKPNEAVILMGHGTPHPANAFYAAFMYQLQQKDPNIFVGTVEGWPSIEEVVEWLKSKHIKKAYLMPFMSVAGDHAKNDMAGEEPDSWKSIITKSGVKCIPILKGTAEFDNMVAIWLEHLKIAMQHL